MILGFLYLGYVLSTGVGFSWLWFLFWIFLEYIAILLIFIMILVFAYLSDLIKDWKLNRKIKNKSDKE